MQPDDPAWSHHWHIHLYGRTYGPLLKSTVEARAREGRLAATTLVWTPDDPGWKTPLQAGLRLGRARPRTPAPPPVAVPVTRSGGNYLLRHWRGEQHLLVAWLVNGMFGTFAYVLTAALFSVGLDNAGTAPTLAAFALSSWLGAFALTVWQLVGIWRSAKATRGDKPLLALAGLARIMAVLYAVLVVGLYAAAGSPATAEALRLLQGRPTAGPYALHRLNDAEMAFVGAINFGAAAELAAFLDAAPSIKAVHLDSPGGRSAEAYRIRDVLRGRGLDTVVARQCLGACAIAFMGGVRRVLDPAARFGSRVSTLAMEPNEYRRAAKDAGAFGIAEDFAKRVLLDEATLDWRPSAAELLEGGFATELLGDAS